MKVGWFYGKRANYIKNDLFHLFFTWSTRFGTNFWHSNWKKDHKLLKFNQKLFSFNKNWSNLIKNGPILIEIWLELTLSFNRNSILLPDFKSDQIWTTNLSLDFESNSPIWFGMPNGLSLDFIHVSERF